MITMLLPEDVSKAEARYKALKLEIAKSKNLPDRLKEVDEAISTIDELIVNAIISGSPHAGMGTLKNELWYLKFQIHESV